MAMVVENNMKLLLGSGAWLFVNLRMVEIIPLVLFPSNENIIPLLFVSLWSERTLYKNNGGLHLRIELLGRAGIIAYSYE